MNRWAMAMLLEYRSFKRAISVSFFSSSTTLPMVSLFRDMSLGVKPEKNATIPLPFANMDTSPSIENPIVRETSLLRLHETISLVVAKTDFG